MKSQQQAEGEQVRAVAPAVRGELVPDVGEQRECLEIAPQGGAAGDVSSGMGAGARTLVALRKPAAGGSPDRRCLTAALLEPGVLKAVGRDSSGVAVAVGELAVPVGVAVGMAVGIGVAVSVGVAVGIAVGVGVAVSGP